MADSGPSLLQVSFQISWLPCQWALLYLVILHFGHKQPARASYITQAFLTALVQTLPAAATRFISSPLFSPYLFWLSSAFPQPSLVRKQNLQTKAAKPRCFQVSPHAPEILCLEVGCRSAAGSLFPLWASTAFAEASHLLGASRRYSDLLLADHTLLPIH